MSYCLNRHCPTPKNPDHHRFCQACGNRLRLGDRYCAIQPLGSGGANPTFLALDTHKAVDARCLIKAFSTPVNQLNAFRQEVAQLDGLGQHPQIPHLHAYFERELRNPGQHQQFLIREWISGQSLQQTLAAKGPFSGADILRMLHTVLPLLEFIHSHRIIHRDIKPTNLIQPAGTETWVLVDFGAAKHRSTSSIQSGPESEPKAGTVIGSAEYTAPEQLRGQATFASDLYSLGATCIHLLTGLSPFELYNPLENRWMWRSVSSPVGETLGQVLDQLIQSDLNQRYPNATEVLQDLGIQSGTSPSPLPPPPPPFPSPTTEASWTCIKTLYLTTEGDICHVVFSPDGEKLAIASNSPNLYLWDMADLNQPCQTVNTDHPISAMAFSPDGRLITGGWDGQIQLRDLSQVGELSTPIHPLSGHTQVVTALAPSPDGKFLISGSRDRTLQLWHLPTGKLHQTWIGPKTSIESLALSPDGKLLASGQADGTVGIWHLPTHELLRTLVGHQGMVSAVAIASQNSRLNLISAGWDMALQSRNLDTGGIIHRYTGHLLPVSGVALSPAESIFATASHDGTTKLWHLSTGMLAETLSGHDGPVEAVAFSPNGQCLVSAGQDQTLRIWQRTS